MMNFITKGVNPPSGVTDVDLWKKATLFQIIYSMTGLVLGLTCIVGGIILFLHGVAGPASGWTVKFLGLESNISDAAPGVILFVVGFFIVLITKFDISSAVDSAK